MFTASVTLLRERLLILAPLLRPSWDRLKASPLGYRLARGTFWSLVGMTVCRALTLLSSIWVARLIGQEGFGELGVIQNTVGMFGVFAGFGLGLTATKYVAEFRCSNPLKAGRVIVLLEVATLVTSLVVLSILALSASWLAQHTLAAPQLGPLLMLGGGLVPFYALSGVQTGALSGLEAFRASARVNIRSGFLSVLMVVLGAYMAGITGLIIGLIVAQAATCLLNHLALRREAARFRISFGLAGILAEFRLLWDFSLPTVFSNSTGWIANWVCTAMLVNQPQGYSEMAIVSVGNQWRAALMFLPGLLTNALLPMLTSERQQGGDSFIRVMSLSHRLLVFFIVPVTLMMIAVAGGIMRFYGHDFAQGRTALIYLLAAAGISAVNSPAGSAIIATGRMWLSLIFNLINGLAFVLLTYLLAPEFGATGLAFAYLGATGLLTMTVFTYLRPQLPEGMFRRNLAVMVLMISVAFGFAII